jgi:MarR family transcriptional regulator, transcriptional regulator for hemolysin
MLEYDFDESVGYWITMAGHVFQQAVNEELKTHGITFRQCQVLGWLALEGDLSPCELAERMHIEPPTLVGILDRMERDGWIRRDACAEDRRKKIIRPLPQAEPIWAKIIAASRRVRARASRGLSAEQLATLKETLAIVQANLQADAPVEEAAVVH